MREKGEKKREGKREEGGEKVKGIGTGQVWQQLKREMERRREKGDEGSGQRNRSRSSERKRNRSDRSS